MLLHTGFVYGLRYGSVHLLWAVDRVCRNFLIAHIHFGCLIVNYLVATILKYCSAPSLIYLQKMMEHF